MATERNSTDTSVGGEMEAVSLLLPNVERQSIIRERNITMASRSSSRSVSCRKKKVFAIEEVDERNERETSPGKRIKKGVSVDAGKVGPGRKRGNIRFYSMMKRKIPAHRDVSVKSDLY